MNDVNLTDLDELAQKVRDEQSRIYIVEAINAYRGGAYRAAIVATWIAVVYDIIAKLRELAKQGTFILTEEVLKKLKKQKHFPEKLVEGLKDLQDQEFTKRDEFESVIEEKIENATEEVKKGLTEEDIKNGNAQFDRCKDLILKNAVGDVDKLAFIYSEDIEEWTKNPNKHMSRLSEFERSILEKAWKEFEFLKVREYTDLKRLQDDRHACAHPAFVSGETLFQPTPEIVRSHIVHTMVHLLQHGPIQGRFAVKKILNDIKKRTFPDNYDDVSALLDGRYFNLAKEVLIKDVAIILIHELLQGDDPELSGKERDIVNTLKAIFHKYKELYKEIIPDKLTKIAKKLEGDQLMSIFHVLKVDQSTWSKLSRPIQIECRQLLQEKATEESAANIFYDYNVFASINITELGKLMLQAFDNLTQEKQEKVMLEAIQSPHEIYVKKTVEMYSKVESTEEAERIGETFLIPLARSFHFPLEHIQNTLQAVIANPYYIAEAQKTPAILEQFLDKTAIYLKKTKKTDIKELKRTKELWKTVITLLEEIEERQIVFMFSKQSLQNLRKEGIPDEILRGLEPLEAEEFTSENEFLDAVKKRIGKEHVVRYEDLLLKYVEEHKTYDVSSLREKLENYGIMSYYREAQ